MLFSFAEKAFWTGAHFDGKAFIWDGIKPTTPQLKIQCPG